MSTNWPNDRINDLPDHNPPTQEFIQDQGSFDIRYPSPGEWLEPSPQMPTRPYPALKQGPHFTNRQMIIIGAAVATVVVVLCGSLVAIGALSNHTTPIARNPISASAAATATAAATLAATDNSGLPTTLPTNQPAATTAPGQPTPTTAATGTPTHNPTATPTPTATTVRTGTFTDALGSCSEISVCVGVIFVNNIPQDPTCAAPNSSGTSYIEWHQTGIQSFQAIGYLYRGDLIAARAAFSFQTSSNGSVTVTPDFAHTGKSWKAYDYSANFTGSSQLPSFVRVTWNVVSSQTGTSPELGQMAITFQH
jgi:hypothetical protein